MPVFPGIFSLKLVTPLCFEIVSDTFDRFGINKLHFIFLFRSNQSFDFAP